MWIQQQLENLINDPCCHKTGSIHISAPTAEGKGEGKEVKGKGDGWERAGKGR